MKGSNMWAIGALLYGLLKGAREIFKKKAMTRNSRTEVLFFLFGLFLYFYSSGNSGMHTHRSGSAYTCIPEISCTLCGMVAELHGG